MTRDLQEARHLELALARLRWLAATFGVVITFLEVFDGADDGAVDRPLGVPFGAALTIALIAGNILIVRGAHRAERPRQLRLLGGLAFTLDTVVALGVVWITARTPSDPAWVVAYLLPLEGAVRYGIAGALAPIPVILASEIAREASLAAALARYDFQITAVAFRVGMAAVVAAVTGLFAASMRREAEHAGERTSQAEGAAQLAEEAARREAQARSDLVAFHTAILAGVAADDASEGIQAIAEAVGRELGCDAFGILLLEPAEPGPDQLVAAGVWGAPGYERGTRFVKGTAPMDLEELSTTRHANGPAGSGRAAARRQRSDRDPARAGGGGRAGPRATAPAGPARRPDLARRPGDQPEDPSGGHPPSGSGSSMR